MNLASIIGLVFGFVIMIFGMVFQMDSFSLNFALVNNFIDIPSVLITFGGSFTTLITMEPNLKSYLSKLASFRLILKTPVNNDVETIKILSRYQILQEKKGLLALVGKLLLG